jgi:hypothetical protein
MAIDIEEYTSSLSQAERIKHRALLIEIASLLSIAEDAKRNPGKAGFSQDDIVELAKSLTFSMFELYMRINQERDAFSQGVSIEIGAANVWHEDIDWRGVKMQ